MLVNAIAFEIRNFKTGTAEQFLVKDENDNYALIAQQKNTREIKFTQLLDFDFDRKAKCPLFLEFGIAVLNASDLFSRNQFEYDMYTLDDIDDDNEMTGAAYLVA